MKSAAFILTISFNTIFATAAKSCIHNNNVVSGFGEGQVENSGIPRVDVCDAKRELMQAHLQGDDSLTKVNPGKSFLDTTRKELSLYKNYSDASSSKTFESDLMDTRVEETFVEALERGTLQQKELVEHFVKLLEGNFRCSPSDLTHLKAVLNSVPTKVLIEGNEKILGLCEQIQKQQPLPDSFCQDITSHPGLLLEMESWNSYLSREETRAIQDTLVRIVHNFSKTIVEKELQDMLSDKEIINTPWPIRTQLRKAFIPVTLLPHRFVARCIGHTNPLKFYFYIARRQEVGENLSDRELRDLINDFHQKYNYQDEDITSIRKRLKTFISNYLRMNRPLKTIETSHDNFSAFNHIMVK